MFCVLVCVTMYVCVCIYQSTQILMSVRVVETTATRMSTVPTLMAASPVPVGPATVAMGWTVKVCKCLCTHVCTNVHAYVLYI